MTWKGRPTAYERILHEEGGVAEHSHYCRYCKRLIVCRVESCGEGLSDRRDANGRSEGHATPICSRCSGGTVSNAGSHWTLSMNVTSATNTTTYTFPVNASGAGWTWDGIPVSNGPGRWGR